MNLSKIYFFLCPSLSDALKDWLLNTLTTRQSNKWVEIWFIKCDWSYLRVRWFRTKWRCFPVSPQITHLTANTIWRYIWSLYWSNAYSCFLNKINNSTKLRQFSARQRSLFENVRLTNQQRSVGLKWNNKDTKNVHTLDMYVPKIPSNNCIFSFCDHPDISAQQKLMPSTCTLIV